MDPIQSHTPLDPTASAPSSRAAVSIVTLLPPFPSALRNQRTRINTGPQNLKCKQQDNLNYKKHVRFRLDLTSCHTRLPHEKRTSLQIYNLSAPSYGFNQLEGNTKLFTKEHVSTCCRNSIWGLTHKIWLCLRGFFYQVGTRGMPFPPPENVMDTVNSKTMIHLNPKHELTT